MQAAQIPADSSPARAQAMCQPHLAQGFIRPAMARCPAGLWQSVPGRDEGKRWTCIARHLPESYAIEVAEVR